MKNQTLINELVNKTKELKKLCSKSNKNSTVSNMVDLDNLHQECVVILEKLEQDKTIFTDLYLDSDPHQVVKYVEKHYQKFFIKDLKDVKH